MEMKHGLILILVVTLWSCEKPEPGRQTLVTEGLEQKMVDSYWLYLPQDYEPNKKWPVILFLQGGTGASGDPRTARDNGPARFAMKHIQGAGKYQVQADSFIIINPHLRKGPSEKRQWFQFPQTLNKIVDDVVRAYNGDTSRIYLTGLSRGGHGSWSLAKRFPGKFAAIVPVAGALSCKTQCDKIANTPMWIVHNTGDHIVEYKYSENAVSYMEQEQQKTFLHLSRVKLSPDQLNSDYILSSLNSDGHDAWSATFSSPDLYTWLLSKRRMK